MCIHMYVFAHVCIYMRCDRQTDTYTHTALAVWGFLGDLPPMFHSMGNLISESSLFFLLDRHAPVFKQNCWSDVGYYAFQQESHSCFQSKPTCAGKAIACVALLAETAVRPHGVLTVSVLAAHVGSIRAFIQILGIKFTSLLIPPHLHWVTYKLNLTS